MKRNISLGWLVALLFASPALSLSQGQVAEEPAAFEGKKVRFLGRVVPHQLAAGGLPGWEGFADLQDFDLTSDLELVWNKTVVAYDGKKAQKEPDSERNEGNFYFQGHKVCGYSLTHIFLPKLALANRNSQNILPSPESPYLLLGSIPTLKSQPLMEGVLAKSEKALRAVGESFLLTATGQALDHFQSFEACLFQKEGMLYPAQEVQARSAGNTYKLWLSEKEVFHFEKISFAAKVQSFERNAKDHVLKIFDMKTKENGFLGNDLFSINTHGVPKAFEPSQEFLYEPADLRFKEASVFVHAQEAMNFFRKLGFEHPSSERVKINIHVLVNGSKNNAMYEPASFFDPDGPTISVGSGDGLILQNLTTDSDVVSHELAHHIIYQTLKSTSGESLVLHEGLADFFTFAKSGDPCLGESICPENSRACFLNTQCLRTAGNDLVYNSSFYNSLSPHQQGQLVSGLLWDLSSKQGSGLEELAKTVMKAVSFLNPRSDIQDFLTAFALADFAMSGGRSVCEFSEIAKQRGFESVLETALCDDIQSWPKIDGSKTKNGSPAHGEPDSSQSTSMDGIFGGSQRGDEDKARDKKARIKGGYCALAFPASQSASPLDFRPFFWKDQLSLYFSLLLILPFFVMVFERRKRKHFGARSTARPVPWKGLK